jgi:hypothetical protein
MAHHVIRTHQADNEGNPIGPHWQVLYSGQSRRTAADAVGNAIAVGTLSGATVWHEGAAYRSVRPTGANILIVRT